MAYLKLVGTTTYTFNDTWRFVGDSYDKTTNIVKFVEQHGGRDVADGKVNPRVITLEGIVTGADTATYLTNKNALRSACYEESQKLEFQTDRYINVKRVYIDETEYLIGNYVRSARVSLTLICEDPFWYYATLSTNTTNITTSPQSWIENNISDYEVYPVITITPSADNFSMIIENTTDNRTLTYIDNGFLSGQSLVIDNQAGTVLRNSVNTIVNKTGNFLRLLKGNNTIQYTGANGTVKFDYYQREL